VNQHRRDVIPQFRAHGLAGIWGTVVECWVCAD